MVRIKFLKLAAMLIVAIRILLLNTLLIFQNKYAFLFRVTLVCWIVMCYGEIKFSTHLSFTNKLTHYHQGIQAITNNKEAIHDYEAVQKVQGIHRSKCLIREKVERTSF